MANVTLTWDHPAGFPAGDITNYILYTRVAGASLFTQQTLPGDSTTAVVSLAPGASAEYQLAAEGNGQVGTKSDLILVEALPAPGAPENVTAVISL